MHKGKIAEEEEEGDDVEDEDQSKRAPSDDASEEEGNINHMQLVVTDNDEAGGSYCDANGCNVNNHSTLQDCSANNSDDHVLTVDSSVNNDDNITMQHSVALKDGLFSSAAILGEVALMTREEVESRCGSMVQMGWMTAIGTLII